MKQRAFEVRNMRTAIHELWELKKGVRVSQIKKLIELLNNATSELDILWANHYMEKYISDCIEINYRDIDENNNYGYYKIVNSHFVDVYNI